MKRAPRNVEELMSTNLVTIYEDQNLDLATVLIESARLRHLPVVSRAHPERLVGLVTHRDLLQAAARLLRRGSSVPIKEVPVGDIMRRRVETARPDESAASAAQRMLDRKFGCLPVVDESGVLVGIVTEADFVECAIRFLEKGRSEEVRV